MTQNIQNFDNKNNVPVYPQKKQNTGNKPTQIQVRIPDYYAESDKKSLKEMLENNPLYTMVVKGFFGPLIEHPIASLFTWFGCSFLLNKYTDACGGKYKDSLFNKAATFGDNLENSKFVQSKPVQKFLNLFKSGNKKIGKFVDNNSVLKSMRDTPTRPELDMVKSEMIPQRQRVVEDFNHIVKELRLSEEGFISINNLALDKKEKDALKAMFKTNEISKIPAEQASSFIQLKRLGKSNDYIRNVISAQDGGVSATKKEILKALGNKDAAWIKAVSEDTIGNYIGEVQEAAQKVGGKVKIGLGKLNILGYDLGILSKPGERTLSMDYVSNRLLSLDKNVVKTATGRFMSKFIQLVHRGLTFGGGKYGVLLFIAPAFVETAINVHKAEPNQKIGTGVNNLVNHISWVFTFPLALQIMHHIGGAKYAGMGETKVQQIRNLQTSFNEKNKLNGTPKGFKDFNAYNTERIKVNEKIAKLMNVDGQKWYTKAIRKVAGWLTPDLGRLDAYNTGNVVTKKFSQMRNLPRNLWGVPLRLVIFGFLTTGVLDTILNKGIKLIFGDSYDSMKDEEIKDAKKEQKNFLKEDLQDRLYEAQREKILNKKNTVNNPTQNQNPVTNAQSISHHGYTTGQELISPQKQNKIIRDNYKYIPSQQNIIQSPTGKGKLDTYTYIPSSNSTIKSDKYNNSSTNIRSYIPSQKAANITKNWDNSGLQKALDRAQRAEDRALKILAGNFEEM